MDNRHFADQIQIVIASYLASCSLLQRLNKSASAFRFGPCGDFTPVCVMSNQPCRSLLVRSGSDEGARVRISRCEWPAIWEQASRLLYGNDLVRGERSGTMDVIVGVQSWNSFSQESVIAAGIVLISASSAGAWPQ